VARSAVSDEEIQLRKRARRRLVGAVALVLMVVAAVPMILDSEPRQRPHRIEVQVPSMPPRPPNEPAPAPAVAAQAAPAQAGDASAPAQSHAAPASPVAAPAPAAAPTAPTSTGTPTAPTLAAAPAVPASGPAPALEATPAHAPAAKNAGPAHAGAGRSTPTANANAYAVALIATASTTKAAALKRELQRLKFPAYTQTTPDGDKTRVRVGPYSSREAAEQARQRLIRQGYDPGGVVRQGD